jgi:inorganic pyrophosphatase
MDVAPIVVDVRIEAPSGSAHDYATEVDSRDVRLRRTVRAAETYPADWAILPGTLTPAGDPLGVLVLTDLPCSPGVTARVRLIGMATVDDDRFLLAVLADDAAVTDVTTWRQVRADVRATIEALLARPRGASRPSVQWVGPAEAAVVVRDARLAARMARAEFHATQGRAPAWKAADTTAPEDDHVHTRPESGLLKLPFRFQEYVARLLVPQERILAFVPRPPERHRVHLPFGRRRDREEGLLVVTDQEILWIEDVLAAPIDVTGYGYVATSVPLERLTAATLTPDHATIELVVEATTPGGASAPIALTFPQASVGLLRDAVGTIEPFLAARTGTALMRIAHPADDEVPLADLVNTNDETTTAAVEAWQWDLAGILSGTERIVAKAVVPGWSASDGVPRLWLVTDERLLEVRGDTSTGTASRSWSAGDLCGVRLTYSVFESSMQFDWQNRAAVVPERFVFPLTASASFTRVFVAIRRIMVGRCGFHVGHARRAADSRERDVAAV